MKAYHTNHGIPLDANFVSHTALCEQCRAFDPERPQTAVSLCLEGSVLWKRENAVAAPKAPRIQPSGTTVSRDEARRAMRYKS